MRTTTLIARSLWHYRRVNAAVVFGVAVAVAVLAGALVVGDSVRASLRVLFLQRVGRADHLITSQGFFRDALASEVGSDEGFARAGFTGAVPLVALEGAVTHEESGRRAGGVQVYGVDDRFWRFHGAGGSEGAPGAGGALLSPALASEFGAGEGDVLLLRVEKPSAVPVETLHGRKDDVGRTLRLAARDVPGAGALREFSLRPTQAAVRAVFVSLEELRGQIGRRAEANAILVSASDGAGSDRARTDALGAVVRRHFSGEDAGVRLRALAGQGVIAFETEGGIVGDEAAEAAREAARRTGMETAPVLSYLANSIGAAGREVPYSVVTALDDRALDLIRNAAEGRGGAAESPESADSARGHADAERAASSTPIILNDWAAQDLGARPGDRVTLEYYLWEDGGRLLTRSADFVLDAVVPISGPAADPDLVPDYPGISGAESVADWDPPFPVDLSRIRPQDETYWDDYRATPKAFIPLARGQELWGSRFGRLTSLRVSPPAGEPLEEALARFRRAFEEAWDPARAGAAVINVRAEGLAASRGATDFGEYFLYFSFFIVASALLLSALFFRLGVEQRLREIGVLRALGFPPARVRNLFVAEGLALAAAGAVLGLIGAYGYGLFVMHGLRTWWVGAVGTTALELHAAPYSLAAGALGGVLSALACAVWTLRGVGRASSRSLIHGDATAKARAGDRRFAPYLSVRRAAALAAACGALLLVAAGAGAVGQSAGFFGGGTLLLIALLCAQAAWLRGRGTVNVRGSGAVAVARLGLRSATHRPGRSVFCITLIAAASFIIVAVDAFRRGGADERGGPKSGTGGYALLAETLLPVVYDPNTAEGREALNLSELGGGDEAQPAPLRFARFRLRPGDDASCLNLYSPRRPRIVAPTSDFVRENRFSFRGVLDGTREEAENPWLLLGRPFNDGAVPVVGDANSLTYVLHLKVGEDFVLERGGAPPVRLRVVGALADSLFQSEFLMSEENFTRLFPEEGGYRFFLIEAPGGEGAMRVAAQLEEGLADYGFDAVATGERLAGYHRVENTYLSTFQMLGGLGLALGTLGLAAVLMRNVLERRRELALLRAVGYGRRHFALMIVAENSLLLLCGVLTGTLCALLAVAPALFARGGRPPVAALGALLLAVVLTGLLASLLATAVALRSPLIPALRSE